MIYQDEFLLRKHLLLLSPDFSFLIKVPNHKLCILFVKLHLAQLAHGAGLAFHLTSHSSGLWFSSVKLAKRVSDSLNLSSWLPVLTVMALLPYQNV